MKRLVFLMLVFIPTLSLACEVNIKNESGVDLRISVDSARSIVIAPLESRRVRLSLLQTIEFGAILHEYSLPKRNALAVLCPGSAANEVDIEARKDGRLWVDCGRKTPPFPIEKKRVTDLTIF